MLEATPTPISELAYNFELTFFLHYTVIYKITRAIFLAKIIYDARRDILPGGMDSKSYKRN